MDSGDLAFLGSFLAEAPGFRSVVRLDPPRALWEGKWLRIAGVRSFKGGVLLELRTGKKLRLTSGGRLEGIREKVRETLLGLLRAKFRGFRVERVLSGTDRVRRQPASILRVLLARGAKRVAVLAVYPGGAPEAFDRVLVSLSLWWDDLARSRGRLEALLLIPEDWSERLVHCLPYLRIPLTCCKYPLSEEGRPGPEALRQIYPLAPEATRVESPYVLFPRPDETPALLADLSRREPELDLTLRRGFWELSYRGLPVAWQERDDGFCRFDLLHPTELNRQSAGRFDLHLNAVRRYRRFPPPESGHPHYQMKPERWLESLLSRDHRLIDPSFSPTFYAQVPTRIDGERRVLDLLTVTTEGRLAVVEVKVERDLGLVFQALDYWERVDVHLRRGDFQRSGYFPGIQLNPRSPLLYLVSPLFEFHRVMPALRRGLRRSVRFRCVGVNSDWRKGLTVLRRFEF